MDYIASTDVFGNHPRPSGHSFRRMHCRITSSTLRALAFLEKRTGSPLPEPVLANHLSPEHIRNSAGVHALTANRNEDVANAYGTTLVKAQAEAVQTRPPGDRSSGHRADVSYLLPPRPN